MIRLLRAEDLAGVLAVVSPMLRAGETYCVPRDLSDAEMLEYWCAPEHEVFVFVEDGVVLGSYFLQANQRGGGAHVGNCGYVTAEAARGRGIARAMCAHSIERARERGFRALQFNHVVSTNVRAVALWQSMGFEIVGTLPGAFQHPTLGFVDSFVMFRSLAAAELR